MNVKQIVFSIAISLILVLPLFGEFQIWGGVYGTVFDSNNAAIIESLGLDYVFVSTVYDSNMGSLAFPALDSEACTDLELLPSGVKAMAQQTHCEDIEGYLKEVHITGQGSAVLRAASAHYENWEAESTTVPSGIPSNYLYRTWFDDAVGSVITTTEDTARGGKYVRFTGETGVVLIAPITYHEDSTDFDDVEDKVSRQYGYYKQNDGGGQNWHKYEVVREGDTASVPIVPYTLSIDVRADTSSLPVSGDVLVFGVYLDHVQNCTSYEAFYDSLVIDADTLRSLVEHGWTGFNTFSFQYTWENAWEHTTYSPGLYLVDAYKKYLFFNYRVRILDSDAIIDIDRIVCWDEPNREIYPDNDNGWGKYIFEPDTLLFEDKTQDTVWVAVKDQVDDFYETGVSEVVYGVAGVTEQCRLSNQWAAARKFTQFISDTFGIKTDFIMASAPPEFAYSYLYYAQPTFNRRNTYRFCNDDTITDYTGIDTTETTSFQFVLTREIEEYDHWRQACASINDSFPMEEVTSNANSFTKGQNRIVYSQEVMVQSYLALAHGIKSIGIAPLNSGLSLPDSIYYLASQAMDSMLFSHIAIDTIVVGIDTTYDTTYVYTNYDTLDNWLGLTDLGQEMIDLIEELEAIGPILYELDFDTAFCAICGGDTVGEVAETIPDISSLVLDSLIGYYKDGDTITSSIYDTNCIEVAFFDPPGDTVGYFMVVNRMANDTSDTGITQAETQFVRLFFTDTYGTSYTFVRHGTWRSSYIWQPQEPAYDGTFDLLVPLAGGEGALISVHIAQDSYISYLEEGANLLSTPIGELCGVPVLSYFTYKSDSSTKVIEPDSVRRLVWVAPESTGVDSLLLASSKPYEITHHQDVYQVFTDTSYSITRAGKGDTVVECSHTTGPYKTFPHSSVVAGGFYGVQHSGNYNVTGDSTSCVLMSIKPAIAHAFNPYGYNYVAGCCVRAGSGYWGITTDSLGDGKTYSFPDSIEEGCLFALDFATAIFPAILYEFVTPPRDSGTIWSKQLELDVNWDGDSITVTDTAGNGLGGCLIAIQVGDSIKFVNTDTSANDAGIAACSLDIGNNDSTWIVAIHPGYRPCTIHPYGSFSQNETWIGDVYINGDITVGSNDTLVILPGTNIYAAYRSDMMQTWMAERIDIVVQGHIIAVGDSLAPITFTVDVPADSTPAPNDWKGIVHHFSGSGEYEHCRFEYMRYFQGHQPGGDATFKNCTFAKPLYNAISYGTSRPSYIDPPKLVFEDCQFDTIGSWNSIVLHGTGDSTRITNCVFDSAASYVFEVKDSGKAIIEACSLNSCYGILTIHDYSSVTMSDCELYTEGSWFGFNVYDAGTLNIDNSLIARSSSGKGPRIYNAGSAEFRYCSITDFTSDGISCESATVDMGTDKDLGHNCVWSDHSSANRLYFATKTADEFSLFGNWIDTLIFGGPSASEIDTGSFFPPDSCDTSIAKIVIEPEDKSWILPEEFELGPARPNPFNSTVTFDYKVPVECDIEIAIYDILGNKIRILFDGTRGSGIHSEVWDGKDDKGRTVASGTYLYRLKADDYEVTRKMTFLK